MKTGLQRKQKGGQGAKNFPREAKTELLRLHKIDDMIRAGGFPSAQDMADTLEVSLRTINRDLDFLRDQYRAPLEYDARNRGWYYTQKDFFIKYVPLKEGEFFSLALFDKLLMQYRNTPIEGQLRSVFKKIMRSLPDSITVDSRFLSDDITFISDSLAKIDTRTFDAVMDALKSRRVLRFEYQPLQKTTFMSRSLDAYHVVCQRGNWYVIGLCHLKNDVRIFSFSRMRNAEVLNERFERPAGFDVDKHIDSAMGVWASTKIPYKVMLLFAPSIGTFAAERIWHEGQKTVKNPDGSVQVEFETTQLPEVKRWVLGQGRTVKVLSPPELICEIKSELEETLAQYDAPHGK